MSEILQPETTDTCCVVVAIVSNSIVTINLNYRYNLSGHEKTIALGNVIHQLMELYHDRLSADNPT